jgi:uncharacterized RDD family membrane protein YckC
LGEPRSDELATLAQRVIARLIDWLIIFAVWFAILAPVTETEGNTLEIPLWARLASLAVLLVYETGLVAWRGQTVGKMIARIRLCDVDTGLRPSFGKSLIRAGIVGAVVIVAGQFFAVVLVFVYFTAAFPSDTRGLLDRAAGTVVVKDQAG